MRVALVRLSEWVPRKLASRPGPAIQQETSRASPYASSLVSKLIRPLYWLPISGGTEGKLQTPVSKQDQWPWRPHLGVPTRRLRPGDVVLVNDHRVLIVALARSMPRYPPGPLLYTTYANALHILPPEQHRLTFVSATVAPGASPAVFARCIEARTGLRARTRSQFKEDSVRWFLLNSEDVGDMASMIWIAMLVGFGVTGVMLYMFTEENLGQYAVLQAMGATPRLLTAMILVQAAV